MSTRGTHESASYFFNTKIALDFIAFSFEYFSWGLQNVPNNRIIVKKFWHVRNYLYFCSRLMVISPQCCKEFSVK